MVGRDTSWAGASVAGESHETLYNWVHQGHDLPGLSDVHVGYATQGTQIQQAAQDLGTAFNALLPYWRGRDAEAAARSVTRFAGQLHALGDEVTTQAHTMNDVHRATVTVQRQIQKPTTPSVGASLDGAAKGAGMGAPFGVPGMIAGGIAGGVSDYNDQVAAAKAAEEQARRDYQAFLIATGSAASSAPVLTELAPMTGGGSVAPPSASPVGAPNYGVGQSGGGAGPAGTATQYAGPSGVGSQVTGAQLASGGPAPSPPATATMAGPQYAPGTGPQGGGVLAPGTQGTRSGGRADAGLRPGLPYGAGLHGPGTGAGGGFGPAGTPAPGVRAGGFRGTGGYGGGGRGPGNFGLSGSHSAGGLDGAGRDSSGGRGPSGIGGPLAGEPASRLAGQSDARSGVVPATGPAGAARSGGDDQEHRRPDYLVGDPEVWGVGVYVAPPVIGEDPDVYQRR
ncbi:MAG: hypothetical protein M3291_07465 [Actinomycetota bacterium]|nr:hypothetical protein [Actinomycetota bacterium]